MNNLKRIITMGLRDAIGLGLAWLGVWILDNERKHAIREMELWLKLDSKFNRRF